MSRPTTPSGPVEPAAIAARLSSLERVMGVLDSRVEDGHLRSARDVTRQITERLSLSPAHTVVALAGATGSGKSSLFNALAGLDLSEVGVRRPVTNAPHACVWGPDGAGPLLDWLSIPYDNRTGRESALDADTQAELRGLVLLDLPDHDSTQLAHRLEVDRLVELVDLLVWVLDPQKYADEAVHSRYLRRLSRHTGVTVVVLNQIDMLNRADQEACLTDIRRLLDADGLRGVPLVPLSALRGDGLPELKARITATVASRQAALRRLAADLDDVADELAPMAGPEVREDVDRVAAKRLYTTMAEAAGVTAVGEAVERGYKYTANRNLGWPLMRWFGRGKADPLAPLRENANSGRRRITARPTVLHPVQRPQVEEALRHLSEDAANALPDPWPKLVHRATRAELDGLPDALDRAVAAADLGLARRPTWWWIYRIVQFLLVLGMFVGTAWVLGIGIATAIRGSEYTPDLTVLALPVGLLFGGLLLGPILHLVGMVLAVRGARLARLRAEQAVLDTVTTVARERVLAPARAELRAYAKVRDALIDFGVSAPEPVQTQAAGAEVDARTELGSDPEGPAQPAINHSGPAEIAAAPASASASAADPPPAGLGPISLDRASWESVIANQPDPFGSRPAPPPAPERELGPTPAAAPSEPAPLNRPAQPAPTPPALPTQPAPPQPIQQSHRALARRQALLALQAQQAQEQALQTQSTRPVPPPKEPVQSAATPPPPPPPPSSSRPGRPRERALPPAPPPRPAVEYDPETAWARSRPAPARTSPPPPHPAGSGDQSAQMFPPPSARSTSENPPTAARRTSSDSRTDASAGGDRTAAPREQSAKPERKGLLGRLLGGRRNDSPDEVERWWAVDDEDKNDPFAEPPAGDDRPRVPGQR